MAPKKQILQYGFLLWNLVTSFELSLVQSRKRPYSCRPNDSIVVSTIRNTHFIRHLSSVYTDRTRNGCTFLAAVRDQEPVEEETILRRNVRGPLTLLLISQFLLFIGVGAVIPSIPLYGKELGFSSAANGVVISIPSVALLALSKIGGTFADQARKPAMIFGMATIAISDFGTATATSLPILLVARLGLGAGRCISESGERGMLADLANQIPQRRGLVLAAQQACAALGIAIGAPLGGIVVEQYGPRAAFLCVTVAATIAMVLYCFLPETVNPPENKTRNDERIVATTSSPPPSEAEWNVLLSQKQWRGLALCQSGASFGFAAKIASIPVLASSVLPGGAAGAGALISVVGLSGLVGAPMGGFLTDRMGAKVTVICSGILSAFGLIFIPIALSGIFLIPDVGGSTSMTTTIHMGTDFVLSLDPTAQAFSWSVLAWGVGAAAQVPAIIALAQQMSPKGSEATALALPKAFGDGTYIIVPFLLGLITDTFPDYMGIECAFAGAGGLLGVLFLSLWCDNR